MSLPGYRDIVESVEQIGGLLKSMQEEKIDFTDTQMELVRIHRALELAVAQCLGPA